jgi:hypothetical protein
MPIGLNILGVNLMTRAIEQVLITPAPKLKRNAGPRNVPVINDPIVTRIKVIIIPALKPYNISAVTVMMFARPKRSHGKGVGISFSNP